MGRRKDLSTEEVLQQVIEASRKLFVSKGYFNTTIPDIVKESGISIGAIYHHFGNKQNLAKFLYDETMEVFIKRLNTVIAEANSLQSKLEAIIKLLFKMTEKNPYVMEYMLFMKHTEIYEDALPICMSRPFQIIKDLLEEGISKNEIREGRLEIVTASFLGIPLKIIELKLGGVIDYPLDECIEETVINSWNAIKK